MAAEPAQLFLPPMIVAAQFQKHALELMKDESTRMELSSTYLTIGDGDKIARGDNNAPVDSATHMGSHLEQDGILPTNLQLELSLNPIAFMITVVHIAMRGVTEVLFSSIAY